MTEYTPAWKQVHLLSSDAGLGRHLGDGRLTGIGTVYIDDVKVEPLVK